MSSPASLSVTFIKNAQGLFLCWARSETCQNMPASLPAHVFIKHAQGLFPCSAKAKHAKNMPASLLERKCAGIASSKMLYQTCTRPLPMLGQSETCQNMPASLLERKRAASLPAHFFQTCTRPLPTLGQSASMPKHASIAFRT